VEDGGGEEGGFWIERKNGFFLWNCGESLHEERLGGMSWCGLDWTARILPALAG
jgi:hypothetical protein